MSNPRIILVKQERTDMTVEYRVECCDFNADERWSAIGLVQLDPAARSYRFEPTAIWTTQRILPPHLYGLSQPDRVLELQRAYRGYGKGAWAEAVHYCAAALLRGEQYPARYAYPWASPRGSAIRELPGAA